MNVVCFRWNNGHIASGEQLNAFNEELLYAINKTGEIYITHTKLDGKYTLRMVIAQTHVEDRHVKQAWELICKKAQEIRDSI